MGKLFEDNRKSFEEWWTLESMLTRPNNLWLQIQEKLQTDEEKYFRIRAEVSEIRDAMSAAMRYAETQMTNEEYGTYLDFLSINKYAKDLFEVRRKTDYYTLLAPELKDGFEHFRDLFLENISVIDIENPNSVHAYLKEKMLYGKCTKRLLKEANIHSYLVDVASEDTEVQWMLERAKQIQDNPRLRNIESFKNMLNKPMFINT